MKSVYLDWAATTPPDASILAEISVTASGFFGNPSSPHAFGAMAREKLEDARSRCARVLGTKSNRIVFTSGGSESNNSVLFSLLTRRLLIERALERGKDAAPPRIAISMIEHACIWEPALELERMGFAIDRISPDHSGFVRPESVKAVLSRETVLVAVMAVNNETGAIQPTAAIAEAIAEHAKTSGRRPAFHVDAVQALGKIPFLPERLGIDTASFSAHKIQGPRGGGALYASRTFESLYSGGGQERGMRPGTENLAASWGLARAMELHAGTSLAGESAAAAKRMAVLMTGLRRIQGVRILPDDRQEEDGRFSPWILVVSFPGIPGEVLVRVLNDEGFAVSTGAACSSRKGGKRRVLEAMGVGQAAADSAIRISQGTATTEGEMEAFTETLARIISLMKQE